MSSEEAMCSHIPQHQADRTEDELCVWRVERVDGDAVRNI